MMGGNWPQWVDRYLDHLRTERGLSPYTLAARTVAFRDMAQWWAAETGCARLLRAGACGASHHPTKACGQIPTQEIVVELSAAMLAALYGYTMHVGTQLQYVQHYARAAAPQDALRVILGTLGQVEAVVQRIVAMAQPRPESGAIVL